MTPHEQIADRETRRAERYVLVALVGLGGLALVGIAVCAGVIAFAVREPFRQGWNSVQNVDMPPVETESAATRQQALRTAFDSQQRAPDDALLQEIEALLEQVIAATRDHDNPAFRGLVNVERYFLEVKKTGLIRELRVVDEQTMIAAFRRESLTVPALWDRCRVVHVQPLAAGREALVTACVTQDDFPAVARLWVIRSGDGWKLYDWQPLDFGLRDSFEHAAFIKYGDDPRRQQHLDALGAIYQASQEIAAGQPLEAERRLRQAELLEPIPEMSDSLLVQFAFVWQQMERSQEALRACERVVDADLYPGALYIRIFNLQARGRHDAALELLDRYHIAVGGGTLFWRLRAKSHQALEHFTDAAACYAQALRTAPDEEVVLRELARVVGEAERELLTAGLLATPDPATAAAILALELASPAELPALRSAAEVAALRAPGSAAAALTRGQERLVSDDLDQAAAAFLEATEKAADEAQRTRAIGQYLEAMRQAGRLAEGYEQSPDARQAFQYLIDGVEEGASRLSPRETWAVLGAHRRRVPDDLQAHAVAGHLHEAAGELEDAAAEFATAIRLAELRAGDQDAEQTARWRLALSEVQHKLGKTVEAYRGAPDPEEAFQRLVMHYVFQEEAGALPELIEAHRAARPNDPWLGLADALAERSRGRAEEALALAKGMLAGSPESDGTLRYWSQWLALELAFASNRQQDFLEVSTGAPDYLVKFFLDRWISDEKFNEAQAFLDGLRSVRPLPAHWKTWQTEVLWARRNYLGVVDALPAFATQPEFRDSAVRDRLFRSLLRLDRLDDAASLARNTADATADLMPLAIVLVRQHKIDELLALLGESGSVLDDGAALYTDEDAGPLALGPEFRALRDAFPPRGQAVDSSAAGQPTGPADAADPDQAESRQRLAEAERSFRRSLDVFCERFAARSDGEEFRVSFEQRGPGGPERLWISVDSFRDERSRAGREFRGTLVDPTQSAPPAVPGEALRVRADHVAEWSISGPAGTESDRKHNSQTTP